MNMLDKLLNNTNDELLEDDNINKSSIPLNKIFKIFHFYKMNRDDINATSAFFKIDKSIIDNIVNAKCDFTFLKKPAKKTNFFDRVKNVDIKLRIDGKNKVFKFKNNDPKYKEFLEKHRLEYHIPYLEKTDKEFLMEDENYKIELEIYNKIYE